MQERKSREKRHGNPSRLDGAAEQGIGAMSARNFGLACRQRRSYFSGL